MTPAPVTGINLWRNKVENGMEYILVELSFGAGDTSTKCQIKADGQVVYERMRSPSSRAGMTIALPLKNSPYTICAE